MMSFKTLQQKGLPIAFISGGVTLTSNVTTIDFEGAGQVGSVIGSVVTETIAGGAGGTWITETVSGTIDGVNKIFTISHTPLAGSLSLTIGRQPQILTTDYTISAGTITYVTAPDISLSGQPHSATYQY